MLRDSPIFLPRFHHSKIFFQDYEAFGYAAKKEPHCLGVQLVYPAGGGFKYGDLAFQAGGI
jgi:hypothetical protein